MKTSLFAMGILLAAMSASVAHAESSERCWNGTAPTEDEYMAKLKTGDICEDARVPDMCEVKVVQAMTKKLSGRKYKDFGITNVNFVSTTEIGITLQVKEECQQTATVSVKYKYLGDCEIEKIEANRDLDCG